MSSQLFFREKGKITIYNMVVRYERLTKGTNSNSDYLI